MEITPDTLCPCGLGSPYVTCCGIFHRGGSASTAEQLMRSRYSAFFLLLEEYLLRTWHSSTRLGSLELDAEKRYLRLIVDESDRGGPFDTEGTVTFTAIGRGPEGRFEQCERSHFVRETGQWRYLDGVVIHPGK